MKNNKKGFTLIELLVVIAIIGLLSTLSVVALNSARARSRDARRVSDVKQIQTALEMHFNALNAYPVLATEGLLTSIGTTTNLFMAAVPTAPLPIDGTCGTNNAYMYQSANGSTYTLKYCLGATTGGIPGGSVQTATPAGIR